MLCQGVDDMKLRLYRNSGLVVSAVAVGENVLLYPAVMAAD